MGDSIQLSVRETNLLRKHLRHLLELRHELIANPDQETVHDLRVSSRRVREVLDYLQPALPKNHYRKMIRPAKNITSRLGELRETEVNLKLSGQLRKQGLIPPIAAELLILKLTKRKQKLQKKVSAYMTSRNFRAYQKFLARLKGSRNMIQASQSVLQRRAERFYNLKLREELNDEQLHQLRILTKKFRYALEIHNQLQRKQLARFILRLKRFQELLGHLHDLYVFTNLVKSESLHWSAPGLRIIPAALAGAIQVVSDEKRKLLPRVKILHNRILDNKPEGIGSSHRKAMQTAGSAKSEMGQKPGTDALFLKVV